MPSWLKNVVLGLVLTVGLPLAKRLLPWVPIAVWVAIEEILRHLTETHDIAERHETAEQFKNKTRECVDGVCKAP